ncbi:MAG: riboflavin biosynthesis protein RibF [Acidobacteriota bacterium]|nr:riboflavin biosynthesis protein RibF [Acidobacteriota bacterium]
MNPTVFHSLEEARGRFGPCSLAIGNFDGVHLGHQALIERAGSHAFSNSITPAVLTFDPHPTAVVAPDRVPRLICTVEERLRLLAAAGAQHLFVLKFTEAVARLSPEQFVSQILVDALDTKAVFVGQNFRFGFKQAGTPEVFEQLGSAYRFEVNFIKPVELRGQVISSTAVRTELANGEIVPAARLLGRCYSIGGRVVRGRGIGSRKTVPTLNLQPDPALLVPHGIYVTETLEPASGRRWPSVTSCGYNPTFGATGLTVETYLLTSLDGPSPSGIEVRFRHFLRREETYPDAETLKEQILKDVGRAEAYWRHAENFTSPTPSIY